MLLYNTVHLGTNRLGFFLEDNFAERRATFRFLLEDY